jgi:HEPN domain-containing protein
VSIKEVKIFDNADEKMKQAKTCFQNEDYPSALHSLNTSLELVLKDKLGIPSTKPNINTSNIIDILAKYKIEPYLYLNEARKYVLNIDNKIKHTGYSPSKIDCINGIKAMEELIGKLRSINLELSEEIRNKIFEGL